MQTELHITEPTIARIAKMREAKAMPDLRLRVTVNGGGCAGFEYKLSWDSQVNEDDKIFAGCVVVDEMSLEILKGAKVDFVTSMMGEDFKILNPNAVSSCGCGTSFSI